MFFIKTYFQTTITVSILAELYYNQKNTVQSADNASQSELRQINDSCEKIVSYTYLYKPPCTFSVLKTQLIIRNISFPFYLQFSPYSYFDTLNYSNCINQFVENIPLPSTVHKLK